MGACAVLGLLLLLSFFRGHGERGPSPEKEMDFITAAEEKLLSPGEEAPSPAPPAASVPAVAAPAAGSGRVEYVVRPGDSLWKICKRELGDPSLADRVARENNLKSARSLKVGTILSLPARGDRTP